MESLPDELLLSVASHLSWNDLCALALVAKKFLPISQELLYQSPSIPPTLSSFSPLWRTASTRLISFLRTLDARPDLAKLVRRLDVHPQCQLLPPGWVAQLPPERKHKSDQGDDAANCLLSECAVAAMIIKRAPNLSALSINMIQDDQAWRQKDDGSRYRKILDVEMEETFGRNSKLVTQTKDGRPCIRVLQNISELRLDGGQFEFWWCTMPSFSVLRIGRFCATPGLRNPHYTTGRVHTIELALSIMDFDGILRTKPRIAPQFLRHFTALKKLVFTVCNTSSYDNGIVSGRINLLPTGTKEGYNDFGLFVATHLSGMAPSLESIEILYEQDVVDEEHLSLSGAIVPLMWNIKPATFGPLQHLKKLKVPHALLLGDKPADTNRLPPKLEELSITHIELGRFTNLQGLLEILSFRGIEFRDLHKIQLFFSAGGWLENELYVRARNRIQQTGIEIEELVQE